MQFGSSIVNLLYLEHVSVLKKKSCLFQIATNTIKCSLILRHIKWHLHHKAHAEHIVLALNCKIGDET